MQITTVQLIAALKAEIAQDEAFAQTDDDKRFLQAKYDELAALLAKKAEEERAKPKEVRMAKRTRKELAPRAVPLKVAADPVKIEDVPVEPETPVVSDEELLPKYSGERYFSVWDERVGRFAGKSVEWKEAVALLRQNQLKLKKQE